MLFPKLRVIHINGKDLLVFRFPDWYPSWLVWARVWQWGLRLLRR